MLGKIKFYNENEGYGFIIAENGRDYFFHISDVLNAKEIFIGDSCEFKDFKNEKGLSAKSVIISENRPVRFLKIDDRRIELSNIVDYQIFHNYKKEIIKEKKENNNSELNEVIDKACKSGVFGVNGVLGRKIANHLNTSYIEKEIIESSYLYIRLETDYDVETIKIEKPLSELKKIERQLDNYFGVIE